MIAKVVSTVDQTDSNIKDENLRESSRIPCHPLIILKFVTPER